MVLAGLALSAIVGAYPAGDAFAAISCEREVIADVVVIDQPLMFNRLGAGNPNGMMFALRRDVIFSDTQLPLTVDVRTPDPSNAGELYELRPDRRPRPMVLRVRTGDCLTVNLQNLLKPNPNPRNAAPAPGALATAAGQLFTVPLDEQPVNRWVGFHAAGMQMVTGIYDDGSIVGNNPVLENPPNNEGGLVSSGKWTRYNLYAEKEGVFLVTSEAVLIGSDGNEGHVVNGLFGQVIVEPAGAAIYRSQTVEEEMRLAIDLTKGCVTGTEAGCNVVNPGHTPDGHPILNYEAVYPGVPGDGTVLALEGKAGLPVLNTIRYTGATGADGPIVNIVHSEIHALVAYGPGGVMTADGRFPASTYPLESVGRRNPTVPNRLEPFRDFSSQFHDETANGQAFPGFYVTDPVFSYVLAGVKDAFMINYGSGGIGSEIIANRLGVGPMHDCLDCSYEEFFLTSYTVGDPGMLVDIPANLGLEACGPAGLGGAACAAVGRKANFTIGAEDPANIHHSYTGDFVKIRNTHAGKEQHIFHLHNHQWLYNPNDDNSNYLDAQGIGPGSGYTYEINFGGSGNRNKSSGDSIFHCHFYPHFAQGMWYHWRHNDTFQTGTILAATPNVPDTAPAANPACAVSPAAGDVTCLDGTGATVDAFLPPAPGTFAAVPTGFHATLWALADTTPAAGARAYPDGEISTGTPIPALVPLPGKPMPVMPGRATVVAKVVNTPTGPVIVGSNAKVIDRTINPGYPFWIAGIEDIVGQRPTTPPLDMANAVDVARAKAANPTLFTHLNAAQADGWDGGLPRHALEGYASGGTVAANVVSATDFSKKIGTAKAVFYPEEGTDLEQLAMAFHAVKFHDTFLPDGSPATGNAGFRTNGGGGPVVGAPFHNPCIDDTGAVLETGVVGTFFSGDTISGMNTRGSSVFSSDNPRIYKGTFMQFDAVLNKVGYHYPQQRIVALWQDVGPIIAKQKAPEPLVFRFNTFDCMVYHNSNLVPENYEMDDYQVRTPTDIISQHIHLPKWDLTTTDGAANGWNYEDGTLSPGAVQERIEAINHYTIDGGTHVAGTGAGSFIPQQSLTALPHPYFARVATALGATFPAHWLGARTTIQRWFADPVVNVAGVDRGLGIIFTHDHYGPSTHQQVGLYATALTEPAGSLWKHNETGTQLACTTPGARPTTIPGGTTAVNNVPCRWDGGPTSWQAQIIPQPPTGGSNVLAQTIQPYREFYFEFTDFQHAYEAGVYMGAGQDGLPLAGTGPGAGPVVANTGNVDFNNNPADAFRFAINPPARAQINPVFPDLVLEVAGGILPGCPTRPCPQAIDVQDPGIMVVNYRHEPVGLRIYDPAKFGPDGKRGMQADGERGDLAFALQSRIDRVIPRMNAQPTAATVINGTRFPPPINIVAGSAVNAGDPFTPMMRTYAGDVVRVKMQAGGDEEEHNATVFGMKWLQAGSGHGRAPNSGWRSAQAAGISEQFTLAIPVVPSKLTGSLDYGYSMDASHDGWWNGMWGILRAYNTQQPTLPPLPTSAVPIKIANANNFITNTTCPVNGPDGRPTPVRNYDITAVLANAALTNALGVTIPAKGFGNFVADNSVGGGLNPLGGTLVYNHRDATVGGQVICDLLECFTLPLHQGPLHDPTAILYVRTADLNANGTLKAGVPVEPLVLRAAAGECVNVTLRNRLPALATIGLTDVNGNPIINPATGLQVTGLNSTAPDLATYTTVQGVVKRDRFAQAGLGATRFDMNLFRPSSWVGLSPQLVSFDVERDGGVLVGKNADGQALVQPGANKKFTWYAGDLSAMQVAGKQFQLFATPVELGGASLLPADRVKQGAKSLVGALVVEPRGATWPGSVANLNKADTGDLALLVDTQNDHQSGAGTRKTRAQATVTAGAPASDGSGGTFRDFSLVLTKGMTQYYKDGTPVEHMNGEAVGIPEDSQEASGMSLNYGIEPLWFRFGLVPQAPFGNAGTPPGAYGSVPDPHLAYSNVLTGGQDPATPVFFANRNQQARIRITNPYGTSRGSTFALHGHVWQRDPYVCSDDQYGLDGKCNAPATGSFIDPLTNRPLVGSRSIGNNPIGFAQGGQESWNAPTHFDIVLPSAGGGNGVAGDYLFRDTASFGNASGVWGILRVQ
jgi:hypothetical protein